MKDLSNYIKEAKRRTPGHWEDFVDEDTGEIVTMWVNDPTPEELAQQEKEREEDLKAYWEKIEKEKQFRKQLNIDKLEDEIWNIQTQLKDLHTQYRQLQIDQEEELGQLLSAGKEAEAEEKAQEYGEQFNNNADEQERLKKELADAKKKLAIENEKWDNFYNKLWN